MRQIKFRAWCPFDKRMLSGVDLLNSLTHSVQGNTATIQALGDARKLMQFTGLLDKNGKEIFEGDILRDGYMVFQVLYKPPAFFMQGVNGSDYVIELHRFNNVEIIGNVYQTPELLVPSIDRNQQERWKIHGRGL